MKIIQTLKKWRKTRFLKVGKKLYIVNGVDNLSYIDLRTLKHVKFQPLEGTTFSYYYKDKRKVGER